ncbi:leucine-rich repeat domain-containing protein [Parabacteroides bouchesdurhonensis]|uniref:leucine-rich repeat domain-containing protein n=1 Tax=Parabacteroides bouchesdurhonensis TaxID=1936995 RepID=UPI000C861150|nr:leucine-rich repeat domain-containing protein [Parabacteroides bouchesdurhonensis]
MNDLDIIDAIDALLSMNDGDSDEFISEYEQNKSGNVTSLTVYLSIKDRFPALIELVLKLKSLRRLALKTIGNADLTLLAPLKQIIDLDLSDNNLEDISPLSNLTQLISLNLSVNEITNLTPLRQLTKLQCLLLESNPLKNIRSLKYLKHLQLLDLSYNNIKDFSPIANLTNMKVLCLNACKIEHLSIFNNLQRLSELMLKGNTITDLHPLKKLKGLIHLDLEDNSINDISALSTLSNLEKLDLSDNLISNISPLEKLEKLKTLNISNNHSISDISPLKDLKKLSVLQLGQCNISDISTLGKLQQVKRLDLSFNRISDISTLGFLTKITILQLSHNLVFDISPLGSLKALNSLQMDYNPLSDIQTLRGLKQLRHLSLNYCQISDITPLAKLIRLENLQLNGNLISNISPLGKLKNLSNLRLVQNQIKDISPLKDIKEFYFLNLSNNKINSLPEWCSTYHVFLDSEYPSLYGIDITGNPLSDPPIEVVKLGSEAIKRYFEKKKKEEFSSIHEAKLILVGDGAAGKTSLQKRLIDSNAVLPKEDRRTRGIEICNWEFKEKYIAHIWDFGGQDVYYPVHRFFLTENSVFVLLASTRNEQHNFDYWIPTLYQFGGSSPIIIGQTCHEGNRVSWNDLGLYISGPQFNIIRAIDKPYFELNLPNRNKGLSLIKKEIIHQLTKLPHCNKDIPNSWIATRDALKIEATKTPCISYDKFKEICDQVAPDSFIASADYKDCASFLHNIGVILWYSNNTTLRDWIILRPEWGMQAVYRIIDDDQIQNRKGQIIAGDFNRLWNDGSYESKHSILKQMLEVFRVAFPKKHKAEEYIMPARLLSMPDEKRWKQGAYLRLEYEYPFMPRGILNQVSAELSRYIVLDQNGEEEVWNNAVNFVSSSAYCQLEEIFYQKKIILQSQGKDARGLAMVVMNALNNITSSYKGVTPKIYVPCTCQECKSGEHQSRFLYDDLIRLSQKRSDVYCNESGEKLSIDDLLYNAGFFRKIEPGQNEIYPSLQTIRIFLASSSELEVDRKEFELFINRENKELIKSGIFISLEIWEDFLDAMSKSRLQDEYNKAVRSSDIFVSLFFTKAGIFTEEEFDTAYGQFIRTGKPYVYTYFKDAPISTGNIDENINSLLAFKKRLKLLGHFPTSYTNIEDLKLKIKKQLDKLLPKLVLHKLN